MHVFGDAHVYVNHVAQVREQLARAPRALPRLTIARRPGLQEIDDVREEDIHLEGYDPHPRITAPVAV